MIAVDAMGGDRAPSEVVRGAADAVRLFGVDVALVGRPEAIRQELIRAEAPRAGIFLEPAAGVIGMDEGPTAAVRHKRDSSLVVGLNLLKSGRARALVSAGNTGAVMAGATLILGRQTGVERPALGTLLPTRHGGRLFLLDVGANSEGRPSHLVQFAQMGHAYAQNVLRIERPRLGLLSIGEEASKGNLLVQDTYERLRRLPGINFIGNVEGKDLPSGEIDVAVTDGFTGNVVLKTAEGVAAFILAELREELTSRFQYKLAALPLRPAFTHLRGRLDYQEYGGAPLLGVRGVVIVAHGRSNARAITNAIRVARDAAACNMLAAMAAGVQGG